MAADLQVVQGHMLVEQPLMVEWWHGRLVLESASQECTTGYSPSGGGSAGLELLGSTAAQVESKLDLLEVGYSAKQVAAKNENY